MKRQLSSILGVVASLVMAAPLSAQLSVPANEAHIIAPASSLRADSEKPKLKTIDYVTKDIYGKEVNVGNILRDGKLIIVDLSAVWCPPCWQLHQSGVFEEIHKRFGPEGTKKLEFFWVDIEGLGIDAVTGKDPSSRTKGDWSVDKEGKKLPYPVISDAKFISSLGINASGAVPQLFVLSADGTYLDCTKLIWEVFSSKDYKRIESLFAEFLTEKDAPASVGIDMASNVYAGETIPVKGSFRTVAKATCKWEMKSGEATIAATDAENTKITFPKAGTYEIVFTVSNANGNATATKTITVKEGPITAFPMFSGFDRGGLDADKYWRAMDLDGDGISCEAVQDNGFCDRIKVNFGGGNANLGAEGSRDVIFMYGTFYPTSYQDKQGFGGKNIKDQNNFLVSAPFTIAADATKPIFSFYHSRFFSNEKVDQIEIYVLTSGDLSDAANYTTKLGESIPSKPKKGDEYNREIVDLSAYKGQTIRLAVKLVAQGSAGLWFDQANVSMDGSLATETILADAPQVSVAEGYITVQGAYDSIKVYDTAGALVTADARLAAGIYVVSLEANHRTYSYKVVVR